MAGSKRSIPGRFALATAALAVLLAGCTAASSAPSPPHARATVSPAPPSEPSVSALPSETPRTHRWDTAVPSVSSARFLSRDFGYATIYYENRKGGPAPRGSRLVVSTDLGRSWTDVSPPLSPDMAISDVFFLDPGQAWLTAYDCAGGNGGLYRTSDGGQSWQRLGSLSAGCSAGTGIFISFADPSNGWLTSLAPSGGGPGSLMRTLDGGLTWQPEHDLPTNGVPRFEGLASGWLAASFPFWGPVFRTTDAGQSWHRVAPVAVAGGAIPRASASTPMFFGAIGVLPLTLSQGGHEVIRFLTTADAGSTWEPAAAYRAPWPATNGATGQTPRAGCVGMASPTVWWVCGGDPVRVAVTTDSGATWNVRRTAVTGRYPTIVPIGEHRAWLEVSRGGGQLWLTLSGGRDWRRLTPGRR